MSETSIASSWRTKRLLHVVKSHIQLLDNRNYLEDEIVYRALKDLAEKLGLPLPEEGSKDTREVGH